MRLPLVLVSAAVLLAACERREATPAAPPAEAAASSTSSASSVSSADASSGSASSSAALMLSPDGLGALRIGMTPAEASAALAAPLVVSDAFGTDPGQCNYAKSTALPGASVMVEGGRVARIDLLDATIKTDTGIARGDGAEAVRAAYGAALTETGHKYVEPPAAYLESWNADRSRGIRYEIDQRGKVSLIYAGGEAVNYVEGCA